MSEKLKHKNEIHAYMHTDRTSIDDGVEQVSTFINNLKIL